MNTSKTTSSDDQPMVSASRLGRRLAILLAASALLVPTGARAVDGTWTLNDNGVWSAIANWNNGAGPVADGAGSTADFNSIDITADRTVSLDSPRTIGSLVFGDQNTASAAGWIVNNNGVGANILTLSDSEPRITVHALGTGRSTTISAVVAGTGGLTKSGAGTLTLSAVNTYTGGTVIDGGILNFSQEASLGAVPTGFQADNLTLNNGATLQLTAGGSTTLHANRGITLGPGIQNISKGPNNVFLRLSSPITGSGGLNLYSTGGGNGIRLMDANTYTGDTTIQAGFTCALFHALALQNSTLDYNTTKNGVFGLFAASPHTYTFGGLKGNKNLPALGTNSLQIGNNNQDTTYSGVISSTGGGITKIGTGTLTLSGANIYSGSTTVSDGVLKLGLTGSIASTDIRLGGGGVFDVTAKDVYTMAAANTYTFDVDPEGSGKAGMLHAAGLDISNARVVLNPLGEMGDGRYVLAAYTSLSGGAFADVAGLPENFRIVYNASGGTEIHLVAQRPGTVFLIR